MRFVQKNASGIPVNHIYRRENKPGTDIKEKAAS